LVSASSRVACQSWNDPTARQASDSDDTVEFSQPDWDDLDVRGCRCTQPLDRTVAKLFLDAGNRCGDVTVTPQSELATEAFSRLGSLPWPVQKP
jgi:hypothetical protein